MNKLPDKFLERLNSILPEPCREAALQSFTQDKFFSIRVNLLKTNLSSVLGIFKNNAIPLTPVRWYADAFILDRKDSQQPQVRELIEKGLIYPQSLSSMLVPLLLGPKPGEYILDMCAAPGSKASQIFALMKGEQGEQSEQSERNEGQLTCLESVRKRFYKLKAVLSLLGASSVTCCFTDARKFDPKMQLFDKILLDAPCSAEGRFSIHEPKSLGYWSIRKIHEMAYKQKGLLLHASRLLKPEGRLIYSTCTLAPEENEEAIDWLLRKTGGALSVVPLKFKGFGDIATYPCLTQWGKKTYHASIRECLRICPTREMEGFFIAQLQKVSSFVKS